VVTEKVQSLPVSGSFLVLSHGSAEKRKNIEVKLPDSYFVASVGILFRICDGDRVGIARFRVDAKADKILGATIVGTNAGNMIGEVTLATQSDTRLGALAAVIHPYPTMSEVIRQAGDLYNRTRLTTTVKLLLRGVIKLQR